MNKTRYKFVRTGYRSAHGDHTWKFGKWYTFDEGLSMCNAGFHCSKGIYQAFSYVQGEILTKVEVKGKSVIEGDKEVWEKMRVVKSWRWTKKDSVLLSIYAARLVLKHFEKEYPDDDRPRKAIEAAERFVKNPTSKNKSAARAAKSAWSAAESAWSAAESAWSAAESAKSAWSAAESAWSAWSAKSAESAAWSAESAARAAKSAARAAKSAARAAWSAARAAAWSAESAVCKKLDNWMLNHTKNLRVLREIRSTIKK